MSQTTRCSSNTSRLRRVPQRAIRPRVRGFTLVELMITVAVAAVLLVIAVPSFRNVILSNKLTTVSNDVVGAIQTARMEAIKSNQNTQLCSDSSANNTSDPLGSACTTQTGAVYAVAGGTFAIVRAQIAGIDMPLKLNGSMTAIRFGGDGLGHAIGSSTPYTGPIVDICTASLSTNNHRVISMTAGSIVTTTTPSGTVACP